MCDCCSCTNSCFCINQTNKAPQLMTWNRILPLQYTPTKTNKKKKPFIHVLYMSLKKHTIVVKVKEERRRKTWIACCSNRPFLKLLNWPNSLLLLTAQLSRTRLAAQKIQTTTNFQSEKQSTPAAADAAAKICINTLQKYSPPHPSPMQDVWHYY